MQVFSNPVLLLSVVDYYAVGLKYHRQHRPTFSNQVQLQQIPQNNF